MDKVKMIVFVVVLGSAWTTALVGIDKWTGPRIEKYEAAQIRKSVLKALDVPFEEETIDQAFLESVTTNLVEGRVVYRSTAGDIASKIAGSGSQGPMEGVLAVASDLETIKGIVIVKNVETPGLGDRVLAAENLSKFKGKKLLPAIALVSAGQKDLKENEVHAITGATLTSKALEKLLNVESAALRALVAGK